jgi:hypothetical protein
LFGRLPPPTNTHTHTHTCRSPDPRRQRKGTTHSCFLLPISSSVSLFSLSLSLSLSSLPPPPMRAPHLPVWTRTSIWCGAILLLSIPPTWHIGRISKLEVTCKWDSGIISQPGCRHRPESQVTSPIMSSNVSGSELKKKVRAHVVPGAIPCGARQFNQNRSKTAPPGLFWTTQSYAHRTAHIRPAPHLSQLTLPVSTFFSLSLTLSLSLSLSPPPVSEKKKIQANWSKQPGGAVLVQF